MFKKKKLKRIYLLYIFSTIYSLTKHPRYQSHNFIFLMTSQVALVINIRKYEFFDQLIKIAWVFISKKTYASTHLILLGDSILREKIYSLAHFSFGLCSV